MIGVVCIGEAFRRGSAAPGSLGLVNVYAMLSGILLLGVNAFNSGWLERQSRGVYGRRFVGAVLLIAAAAALQQISLKLR